MTVIYLIRHSKATKNSFYVRFSNRLAKNKNLKLDNEGIEIAKNALNNPLFDDVDNIYSSDYNRAKQTAKFLARRLNKNIIFDQRLGERIHGNEVIPNDFEEKQMNNINYKLKGGESQKEVRSRMLDVLNQILEKHNDKKVAIFTHSTAVAFMLKEWCNVKYQGDYIFDNNVFFNGKWDYCETFRLTFDGSKLVGIENIKHKIKKVEIGMLCKENLNFYINMLEKKGIPLELDLITRDIYYTNKKIDELKELEESEIKHSCIRIRCTRRSNSNFDTFKIQNYDKLSHILKKNLYKMNELDKINKILEKNGYAKIIDTIKTDYQYLNGRLQLQYIDDVGMIVFLYNPKYYYFDDNIQFDLLKKDLTELGFKFVYPLGIDRLRTKLNNKLCFSKNQNG